MKNNSKLGAILAVVGILTGLLVFYLLASQYNLVIDAKTASGRVDEATSVTITYAVLGWIGITAEQSGPLSFMAFLTRRNGLGSGA